MRMTVHGEVGTKAEKSHGHIGFCDEGAMEYFEVAGEVYRAPITAVLADISGPAPRRHGRWEGARAHFERYRHLYGVVS